MHRPQAKPRSMPRILVASIVSKLMEHAMRLFQSTGTRQPIPKVRATKRNMGHIHNPPGSKIARKLVGKRNWEPGTVFHGGNLTRNTQASRYARALQTGTKFEG